MASTWFLLFRVSPCHLSGRWLTLRPARAQVNRNARAERQKDCAGVTCRPGRLRWSSGRQALSGQADHERRPFTGRARNADLAALTSDDPPRREQTPVSSRDTTLGYLKARIEKTRQAFPRGSRTVVLDVNLHSVIHGASGDPHLSAITVPPTSFHGIADQAGKGRGQRLSMAKEWRKPPPVQLHVDPSRFQGWVGKRYDVLEQLIQINGLHLGPIEIRKALNASDHLLHAFQRRVQRPS